MNINKKFKGCIILIMEIFSIFPDVFIKFIYLIEILIVTEIIITGKLNNYNNIRNRNIN